MIFAERIHRAQRTANRMAPHVVQNVLCAIVALLDGAEWTPDRVDEVARVLRQSGFILDEPAELPSA